MTSAFHKTRLAPTPSGFLHLGNVYSFLVTVELAKKNGASVLLRIDDMDRERVERKYIEDIFETLRFLDIPWDEGPKTADEFEVSFSQRHRLPMYEAMLERLAATGLVYACECSRKQIAEQYGGVYPGTCRHKRIPLDAKDVAWRIDTASAGEIKVQTTDGEIITTHLPDEMHHFVIRKKDGFPAYQLTSLADDLHYGVDLIVRGEDLWPSTLAQLFLAEILGESGFLSAAFCHHRLLTDASQRKLSKSKGDTSIRFLRKQGLPKEEILARILRG